jgi:hypothetical protein
MSTMAISSPMSHAGRFGLEARCTNINLVMFAGVSAPTSDDRPNTVPW